MRVSERVREPREFTHKENQNSYRVIIQKDVFRFLRGTVESLKCCLVLWGGERGEEVKGKGSEKEGGRGGHLNYVQFCCKTSIANFP